MPGFQVARIFETDFHLTAKVEFESLPDGAMIRATREMMGFQSGWRRELDQPPELA